MSDTVIRVENLSKKYIIRHQQVQQYTALRDVIADGAKSIGHRLSGAKQDPSMGSTQEEFWALKDVSFEVKQGDRIGIIGRNGAGKSTLLKILSRIVRPTAGAITLSGNVASLLEVGTGFHPELTGRENIFLNGAVLGMGKTEIKKKFDEIVAFSEVEKFLDTPVKKYSSGMYVRLAFAVAAHLEPEILIVDEVLAVGDTQFQKKCLGKMENVAEKEGRTILFVSHQMAAIQNLCPKVILLNRGSIEYYGTAETGINQYIFSNSQNKSSFENDLILKNFAIYNQDHQITTSITPGESVEISVHITVPNKLTSPNFGYGIVNILGERITTLHTEFQFPDHWEIESEVLIKTQWKNCKLCPGTYKIMAALYDGFTRIKVWDEITLINIESNDYYKTGKMPETGSQGWFLSDAEWTINPVS